ncbi:MAG: AsmA-like C-terminal domain-containing protein [Deltaproteobacteria bacterium]|nr:AsmA-like C-terminal domain-containing protein [Deltaproteobacteria bacterium]
MPSLSKIYSIYVREGVIPEISFETSGRSFADLGNAKNVVIAGMDSVTPKFSILKTAISAAYERIPYPIVIKEGRLQYDDGKITLEDVRGAIGSSFFSGLAGSLSNGADRHIEISSGSFSLDLDQLKDLLPTFEAFQENFKDVHFIGGRVELVSLFLKGPLNDPKRWDFRGAGSVDGMAVKHEKLPGVMKIARGGFSAAPAKFTFAGAKVEMLDASLIVDGFLEGSNETSLFLEATAAGTIGAQMTGWLSHQAALPGQLALRPPLRLTDSRVLWRKGGDVYFRGEVTFGDEPRIYLDVVRGSRMVAFKELAVVDGKQRARITLDLERDKLALSFKGALGQKTLNRVFQSSPFQSDLLQGDIEISALISDPLQFSARGRLEGKNLLLPFNKDPVIVEKFLVEGGEDGMQIRSADFRWRSSQVSLLGKLASEKTALRVDMDVSADQLVWEEISGAMKRGDDHRQDKRAAGISLPHVAGDIRLKAARFTYGRFNLDPLRMRLAVSSSGLYGKVEEAVICGIRAAGRLMTDDEVDLDVRFSVTDGQLQESSLCLSNRRQDIRGTYSLDAQVAGRGDIETLAKLLKGRFALVARDGEIVRAPALDATFDYLNKTDDFSLAFPDLDTKATPYRLISAKGTIEGTTIMSSEAIIEVPPFTITGQGKIDLEHKQIDGKGLISMLMPADQVIRQLPVLGSIIGTSLVSIPVQVTGSLERPNVTYLSPAAVGTELLNIPARVLGVPFGAIQLFTPSLREPKRK